MQKPRNIHFTGLDNLRFLAAFIVLISHVQTYMINIYDIQFITSNHMSELGGIAVSFFFVLSGFLITYLFYQENRKTKSLNCKYFYIRRILRIWPLYYLVLLIAVFGIPFIYEHLYQMDIPSLRGLLYYYCMVPQIGNYLHPSNTYINHLWSIGAEELFYFIWPVFLSRFGFNLKYFIRFLFCIAGLYLLNKTLTSGISEYKPTGNFIAYFFYYTRLECFIIGACGAILFINDSKYIQFLNKKYTSLLFGLLFIFLLITHYFHLNINLHGIYACLFCLFIINIVRGKYASWVINNKYIGLLGRISYGIYLYHPLILFVIVNSFHNGITKNFSITYVFVFFLTVILTILVSGLSYVLFETPLLKLKTRFYPSLDQ